MATEAQWSASYAVMVFFVLSHHSPEVTFPPRLPSRAPGDLLPSTANVI